MLKGGKMPYQAAYRRFLKKRNTRIDKYGQRIYKSMEKTPQAKEWFEKASNQVKEGKNELRKGILTYPGQISLKRSLRGR